MQQDFYTVEGLANQLLTSAFINLNNIPDYRLRPMLRILFLWPLDSLGKLLQYVTQGSPFPIGASIMATHPVLEGCAVKGVGANY